MDNNSNYIIILRDSLKKKVGVLDEIIKENEKQKKSVTSEKMDDDAFQASIDNKGKLIEELNTLDRGFETAYDRVKDVLTGDEGRKRYASEIREMKELISLITDRVMHIERQEKENQALVAKKLTEERNSISRVKNAGKVAAGYYKTMNKIDYAEPQFMDQKK